MPGVVLVFNIQGVLLLSVILSVIPSTLGGSCPATRVGNAAGRVLRARGHHSLVQPRCHVLLLTCFTAWITFHTVARMSS